MQTLKYVRSTRGTSKKGNEYDMTEVSDGISSFTLSNAKGIYDQLAEFDLEVGDEFQAEVHVSVSMGSLRGIIKEVSL